MNPTELTPTFVAEKDAAKRLGISVKTLQRWRSERRGPAYSKVGGRLIRYAVGDLDHFFEQSRINHND